MRIILDTNVLWRKDILEQLSDFNEDVIVPVIVFAERARQYRKHGYSSEKLKSDLESINVEIEALNVDFASKYSQYITDDESWKHLARDSLIAGHVGTTDQLWTSNFKDFIKLGLNPKNIVKIV